MEWDLILSEFAALSVPFAHTATAAAVAGGVLLGVVVAVLGLIIPWR